MKIKTDAQLRRFAAKAKRALEYAAIEAEAFPTELGTPCAEAFAESGIELAAQGLSYLTVIKCHLRLARLKKAKEGAS